MREPNSDLTTNKEEGKREILMKNQLPIRFVLPVFIVSLVKICSAMFLFYHLNLHNSDIYWINAWGITHKTARWQFLFLGWDSEWYLKIVLNGYSGNTYAFLPGYPATIYISNLIIGDVFSSAVMCSLIFGVAWIPFFQAIAENYMPSLDAFRCTLITSIFPYILLFTTVAYSESLFLFACVSSWYFYINNKTLKASILATLATITRMVGILIVLPMFLDLLKRRKHKQLLCTLIPLAALLGWFYYCFRNTGDWLATVNAQLNWGWTSLIRESLTLHNIGGIILIILISILIYYSRNVDWRLTTYFAIYFFVMLFASIGSIARLISFVFPLWITLIAQTFRHNKWSKLLTIGLCIFFLPVTLSIWNEFLMGKWIA